MSLFCTQQNYRNRKGWAMRVLLVEDDRMIGEAVENALQDAAYTVDWAHDGMAAQRSIEALNYDIVLLDLGLPKKSGIEVLRAIRSHGHLIPVVVITARDAVEDRIQGLDAGADDYVLKPFDMSELLARMRAILRRKSGAAGSLISNGIISLDPTSREARVGSDTIRLSAREFSLLYTLMIRPGSILSRSELEERIYGWNEEVESNAVEFLIHSLRKKMGSSVIKN
ncbi:MAG: response regulator transcription factor, partial [Arenimonas sp.]